VISIDPSPKIAYDLRNYENGKFQDKVYEDWTSECKREVSDLLNIFGEGFEVYENWAVRSSTSSMKGKVKTLTLPRLSRP